MAKIDYNSITFRNADVDKFQGKFGQPKTRSVSASSTTLANPFTQKTPLSQGLGDTSIKRPAAPKAPAAKPTDKPVETKPTAMASEAKAPVRTVKDVKRETKLAVAEAKGKSKVAKANMKSNMTPDDKMALREKRAGNFGKAVKGAAELVSLGAATYLTAYNAGKKKGDGN